MENIGYFLKADSVSHVANVTRCPAALIGKSQIREYQPFVVSSGLRRTY